MAAALKLLHAHDRLEAEVLRALAAFDEEARNSVIAGLVRRKLLDDRRVIAEHLERRVRQGKGLARIEAELLHRGASQEDVSQAMEAFAQQENQRAYELGSQLLEKNQDLRKVARALASRGFDEDAITSALDRLERQS